MTVKSDTRVALRRYRSSRVPRELCNHSYGAPFAIEAKGKELRVEQCVYCADIREAHS
jgi:hypothetical protein